MLNLIKKLDLWWPRVLVFLLPSYFVFYKALVSFYEALECYAAHCGHGAMLWGWGRVYMLMYGALTILPQLFFYPLLSLSYARIDAQADWSGKRKRNEKRFRIVAFVWTFLLPLSMLAVHEVVMVVLFLINKMRLLVL